MFTLSSNSYAILECSCLQFWAVFVACATTQKDAVRQGFDQVDVIHKFVDKYPMDFQLVTTATGTVNLLEIVTLLLNFLVTYFKSHTEHSRAFPASLNKFLECITWCAMSEF